MAEREVRYCTTQDGVRIAFSVRGEGPALIHIPNFVDSFLARLARTTAGEFEEVAGRGCMRVHFDHRGTGLSDRDAHDISIEKLVADVDAVVRAVGQPTVSIIVSGLGGPVALAYAALHAETVSHLVLYETFAALSDTVPADQLASYAQLCRSNWRQAAQLFADMSLREQHNDYALQVGKDYEAGTTGEHMARLIELGCRVDAGQYFDAIRAKTLVIHRRDDPVFPFSGAQRIASGIRSARLVPLEGSLVFISLGDVVPALETIDEFLPKQEPRPGEASRREHPRRPESGSLRSVLFTDMVGHAEMMQRLGDEQGRDVLREHERITRETLKQHGGAEVKTMGDGFMASFGSVTQAMECAIALQRAFAQHTDTQAEPLSVRVGLNAGEPIAEDGDLFGATVILAARIAAKAEGGEILIPEPVRHLLAGKSFTFADRGECALKGFDDAVRLYEVRWRE